MDCYEDNELHPSQPGQAGLYGRCENENSEEFERGKGGSSELKMRPGMASGLFGVPVLLPCT